MRSSSSTAGMSSCAMNMSESPIANQSSAAGTTSAAITTTTINSTATAAHGAANHLPASSSSSWCKRKRCSSSAEELVELLPTHQPTAPKHGRHAASVMQQPSSAASSSSSSAGAAVATAVYITLAAESPHRSDAESEDSMYGSFHAIETDVCRDTSDTDSYSTEEFATLDVLEYEIPSDSSTNEELYSHDSSSGTDDFVVTAAQLARAIFASQQSSAHNTSDSDVVGALAAAAGSGAPPALSSEFELFADTEESDAPTDPELGRADYWTCVKCKNRQNNPMYRYCERCYQIRKTHFPPRPKVQKARSPATSQLLARSRAAAGYSYGSSDDDDQDVDDDDGGGGGGSSGPSRSRRQQRRRQRTQQRQQQRRAAAAASVANARRSQTTAPNSAAEESDGARSTTSDLDLFSTSQSVCNTQSTIGSQRTSAQSSGNVVAAGAVPPTHLPLFGCSGRTRDSGFQSSSTSTADLTPDAAHRLLLEASSQETYCSDVEERTTAAHEQASSNSGEGVALAVTGSASTLSNASTISSRELPLTRSVSSCSSTAQDETLNATVVERSKSAVVVGIGRRSCSSEDVLNGGVGGTASSAAAVRCSTSAFSAAAVEADAANGMCMMCLTEPKNGVFVHSRFLHLCCCYRCAVKVWNKQKRCPICNCKVKNVMKLFVH